MKLGDQGKKWKEAFVKVPLNSMQLKSFQILIQAVQASSDYRGDIAIDDYTIGACAIKCNYCILFNIVFIAFFSCQNVGFLLIINNYLQWIASLRRIFAYGPQQRQKVQKNFGW